MSFAAGARKSAMKVPILTCRLNAAPSCPPRNASHNFASERQTWCEISCSEGFGVGNGHASSAPAVWEKDQYYRFVWTWNGQGGDGGWVPATAARSMDESDSTESGADCPKPSTIRA
jgi:hypothetical protein